MRLAFTFLPLTAAAIALTVISFFPLTESRCREIRKELEDRRGGVTEPTESN